MKLHFSITFFLLFLTCAAYSHESLEELHLKIASSLEDKTWGLMGVEHLNDNQGMLFPGYQPSYLTVWSFNCLIDLTLIFLDETFTVCSVHYLKSYPEKMDPLRPIHHINDLKLYHTQDPIRLFFLKHSITSPLPSTAFLELNASWIHKIYEGDRLIFDQNKWFILHKKR